MIRITELTNMRTIPCRRTCTMDGMIIIKIQLQSVIEPRTRLAGLTLSYYGIHNVVQFTGIADACASLSNIGEGTIMGLHKGSISQPFTGLFITEAIGEGRDYGCCAIIISSSIITSSSSSSMRGIFVDTKE